MNILRKINLIVLCAILLIAFSPPVLSFDLIVPDTGQDLCYDWERIICDEWHMEGANQVCDSTPYCPSEGEDFYGQDAHYTINPPDFTDNEDGTVSDNLTGLLWEQKTEENEPNTYTHNDAIAYCENLSLGDYDDWRVPTRREYSTILNLGTLSPALDTTYFPFYSTVIAENDIYYWTASDYHDDNTKVWKIQISFGTIEEGAKEALSKVRCVSGDTEPEASYTDNGNGTVADNVTGLMWEQKADDGGSRDKDTTHTWKDALAYCEDLILGGFSEWRLPNPKELERMVDLEKSNPAVDTTYFPNTNDGYYWTSSTCVGCHKFKAFAIDSSDGELYFGIKFRDDQYPKNYTRCVRTSDVDATTTTTSPVVSTTTTTISSQGCSAGEIYGDNSGEAQLLRSFRDNILNKTPEGQEMIRLYYEWSPVLVKAMEKDKKFKEEVKALVDEILLMVRTR